MLGNDRTVYKGGTPTPRHAMPDAAASAAPAPKTVEELIELAEDRRIPKGMTVRVSPKNPDVQTKGRAEELQDSLAACGIKLVWDTALADDAIVLEAKK